MGVHQPCVYVEGLVFVLFYKLHGLVQHHFGRVRPVFRVPELEIRGVVTGIGSGGVETVSFG